MSGVSVPLDRLRPHPDNIRDDLGDLTELATSIATRGLLQPLVVAPAGKSFLILDGHRRFAAAKLAGLASVPCLAVRPGDTARDTAVMLAAAMHKALSPLERGRAFKALRRRGMTPAEIARQSGYSPSTVASGLLLADLPPEAHDLVASGDLTATAATQMAREARRAPTSTPQHLGPRVTWLNTDHKLASMVANSCAHDGRTRIGNVGCGQCWEDAIRFDERDKAARRAEGKALSR